MSKNRSPFFTSKQMLGLSLVAVALLGGNSKSAVAADAGTSGKLHTQSSSESDKQNKGNEGHKMSIYDFQAKTLDGKEVNLDTYKGDVVLIVNTASKCGFTPQYQGLEELHQKYSSRGLKVLGFPCNQFGEQEPGDNHQIANFCQKNYGVDFQMFDKVDVNGPKAHPLYKYLTSSAPGIMGSEAIKWNFTKFLIDRQGNVLKRYAPNVEPKDIATDIEKQL